MSHAELLQRAILQIAHDSIEFYHAVGDRSTGGKGNTLSAGDLIQVLALHEHVRTLLRIGLGNAGDIPHLCIEESILVKM